VVIKQSIAVVALRIRIDELQWDLIAVMVSTLLFISIISNLQSGSIRVILGLVFTFFIPGYVITSALFPTNKSINNLERLTLSFGLSFTLVPLIGLLLNFSRLGFNLYSILFTLIAFTIIFCVIAWFRRIKIPIEERFYIKIPIALPAIKELFAENKLFTLMIVISVIIAVSAVVYITFLPQTGDRYTEFYIFDENRTTEDYPKDLTIGESGSVVVGIFSHEQKRTTYFVEIKLLNMTGERANLTLKQYKFTLEHDKFNETMFNFSINDNGTYKMQFILYINNVEEPYRELHLWIKVKS
jgi:uncharacterized membrane protein